VRVAALYDVHGNLPALEAVLAQLDHEEPDLIVVGGDVVAGPMPRETLELVREAGPRVRFIRGNADREVVAPEPEGLDEEVRRALEWTARELSEADRHFLGSLPESTVVDVDGLGPTLFCHATPRGDTDLLTRDSPDEWWREALAEIEQRVVVVGHTHVQFDRVVDGVRVVNAGSVGMPYEASAGARWATFGPAVELRRTEYDLEQAAERLRDTEYPDVEQYVTQYVLSRPTADEATEIFEAMARERRT
jgi:predicted phosphodiesterase